MTTVTNHTYREPDLGCMIEITERLSPGPREITDCQIYWDAPGLSSKEFAAGVSFLDEALRRKTEVEAQVRAEAVWPSFRILSVVVRYLDWLQDNVADAAPPPDSHLGQELDRLRKIFKPQNEEISS